MDFEFPIQNMLEGFTTTEMSKNQSNCFQQNLNLLTPNPLFLTENYAKHTFQAPGSCFTSGLTIGLLLFNTLLIEL